MSYFDIQDLLLDQNKELADLTEFMLHEIRIRRNLDQINDIMEDGNERNMKQRIIPGLVALDNIIE